MIQIVTRELGSAVVKFTLPAGAFEKCWLLHSGNGFTPVEMSKVNDFFVGHAVFDTSSPGWFVYQCVPVGFPPNDRRCMVDPDSSVPFEIGTTMDPLPVYGLPKGMNACSCISWQSFGGAPTARCLTGPDDGDSLR